ncbi:Hypothetical predicted protein [Cloeon dipterum]|uniref:HTH CENPB-type domain-containing protein n=1 Tax=Cloeon dipterum TaxID=197152 RepID=A0A8S1DLM9_9INSE|nr:Hypothetical predicted protein [Cloeon dipterum]
MSSDTNIRVSPKAKVSPAPSSSNKQLKDVIKIYPVKMIKKLNTSDAVGTTTVTSAVTPTVPDPGRADSTADFSSIASPAGASADGASSVAADKQKPEAATPVLDKDELRKLISESLGSQLGNLINSITNSVEAKLISKPNSSVKKQKVPRKKRKLSTEKSAEEPEKIPSKPLTARHVKEPAVAPKPSTSHYTMDSNKKNTSNGQSSVFVHSNTKRMEYPPNEYSIEDVHKAVVAIFNNEYTQNAAAKLYNVPRSTLTKKLRIARDLGYVPDAETLNQARGPKPQFSNAAENSLKDFIFSMFDRSFSVPESSMRDSIVDIAVELGEVEGLKKPSGAWRHRFIGRHPGLKEILDGNKKENSDEAIHAWYTNLWNRLQGMGMESLLSQPERVFTIEEIALPITEKKIYRRNECKWYYCTDKQAVRHACICFNAAGVWTTVAPIGWFSADTKFDHIQQLRKYLVDMNLLNPHDNHQKVILFLDGQASSITYKYFKFCEDAGIVLWSLLPKYKTIKLPADRVVEVIRNEWPEVLNRHYLDPNNLSSLQFSNVCKEALEKLNRSPAVMKTAFKECGIVPFSLDEAAATQKIPCSLADLALEIEVDEQLNQARQVDEQALVGGFNFFCSFVPAKKLKEFESGKGTGKLYKIWKDWSKMVNDHVSGLGVALQNE